MSIKGVIRSKVKPPFKIKIHYNPSVNIGRKIKGMIENNVSWKITPSAFHPGRSAHLSLEKEPIIYQVDNKELTRRALKLKGVGNFNNQAIPPQPREYKGSKLPGEKEVKPIYYMRTNEKGEIIPIFERSEISLFTGALSVENAQTEYELTREGLSKGLSYNLPMCWGSYEDLKFGGETMGFVVLGLRDRLDRRFGDLTKAEIYESQGRVIIHFNDYLYSLMPIEKGKQAKHRDILSFFQGLYLSFGEALRAFHNAGFLRFSAHTGNYSVDEDTKEVVLADLDTIIKKPEINPATIFLEQLFDVVCGIRGIHEISFNTPFGTLYLKAQKRNPYFPFLKGYFDEFSFKGKEILLEISKHLWEKTVKDRKEGYEHYFRNRHTMDTLATLLLFDLMGPLLFKEEIKPPYSGEELKQELKNYNQRVLDLQTKLKF